MKWLGISPINFPNSFALRKSFQFIPSYNLFLRRVLQYFSHFAPDISRDCEIPPSPFQHIWHWMTELQDLRLVQADVRMSITSKKRGHFGGYRIVTSGSDKTWNYAFFSLATKNETGFRLYLWCSLSNSENRMRLFYTMKKGQVHYLWTKICINATITKCKEQLRFS